MIYKRNFTNNPQYASCFCASPPYNKTTTGQESASTRISSSMRQSQIIRSTKGGRTQYGNFYLGQPLNVNYLGRTEGMPGGSGIQISNRF